MNRLSPAPNKNIRAFIAAFITYLLLAGQVAPLALAAPSRSTMRPAPVSESAPPLTDSFAQGRRSVPAPVPPGGGVPLPPVGTPNITATKVDAFPDPNSDGKADPGETITYTVTISNTGTADATNVAFSDTVDANTTLVPSSGTLAAGDDYNTIGNVQISVSAPGLLANDLDVDAGNNTGMTASGGSASTQGGAVTINSNGSFTYDPPVGFTGTDTFTYTATTAGGKTATATARITVAGKIWFINNNGGACTSNCDGRLSHPFTSLANFQAVNDNGVALSHPKTGDNIFIYESGAGYTGPVTLLNNQKFIGQDATASLITITGLTQPSGTDPLPAMNSANGTIATINSSASNGINLGQGNTIRGLTISGTTGAKISGTTFGTLTVGNSTTPDVTLNGTGQALNLTTGTFAATSAFTSVTTTSSSTSGLTLTGVAGTVAFGSTTVSGNNNECLVVSNSAANISFGNTSCTGGGNGVSISGAAGGTRTFGTLSVSGGSGNAYTQSGGGGNVTVNGAATLSSGAPDTIVIQNANGNTINFAGGVTVTHTGTGGNGIQWSGTNSGSTLTFESLALTTSNGTGLNLSGGGTVNVTNNSKAVSATGIGAQIAPAIIANGVALNANFSGVSCNGSGTGGNCISLTSVTGTSDFGTGSLTGAAGATFLVSGGAGSVTYNGTITQGNAARVVDIQNKTGGTVSLGGAVSTTGTTSTGVILNSNTNATINFTGGVALTTNANDAFTATGGGIVNVSGTNNVTTTSGKGINWSTDTSGTGVTFNNVNSSTGGAVVIASSGASNFTFNDVTSTTGTAVSVSTATGAFSFHKISSNGAAKGITVSALTGAGSFTVTGTGGSGLCDAAHIGASDCAGGTIQSASARGIEFTNAVGITLKNMYLKNDGTTAIAQSGGTCNPDVGAGDNTACNAALYFNGATTVSLDRMFLDGGSGTSKDNGINANGVNGFTFTNSEVKNFWGNQKDAANIQNPTGTWNIGNTFASPMPVTFDNNRLSHNWFITANSGTSNITFTNTTISNSPLAATGNASGISALARGGSTVNITADHCNIHDIVSNAVNWATAAGGHMTSVLSNGTATQVDTVQFTTDGNNSVMNYTITGMTITTQATTGHSGVVVGRGDVAPNGVNVQETGTVTNNNITVNSSTCSTCLGISLNSYGQSGLSTTTVTGNTISGNVFNGINLVAAAGANSYNLTLQNNTVSTTQGVNSGYAIDLISGQSGTDSNCVFVNLGDMSATHNVPANKNTANGTWGSGANKISIAVFDTAKFKMLNYPGSTTDNAAAAAWVAASNTPAGADAVRVGSGTWGAGPVCPLLLALGGISSAHDMFQLTWDFDDSQLSAINVSTPATPSSAASDSLSQPQLDSIVSASLQRWAATGLTPHQVEVIRAVKFEISDLSGSYLGEASGDRILVDRSAEGHGWFVDSSPTSDALFARAVSSTRLYTDPLSAPAGHVDLLTAVEHEMGHRLGLPDTYLASDRDSLMYGYLTVGERRLPSFGQASGATPGSLSGTHFLSLQQQTRKSVEPATPVITVRPAPQTPTTTTTSSRPSAAPPSPAPPVHVIPNPAPQTVGTVSINIGTLRVGDSVQITFQVTVNNPYSGGPNVSNQGTVSGSNFSNVLTDDTAVGGSSDPTLTPINSTDIRVNDAKAAEPVTGNTPMLFTLTLSQPAPGGGLSVNYATADQAPASGHAVGGASCDGTSDYVTASGTASVSAGSKTATIPVTICSDSTSEPDETLLLNISSPSSGTITDSQAVGTITVNTPGTFIISELRTRGSGGAGDDFVEFYNNTNSPLTVAASDASAGFGLFKMGATCSDTPVLIATIPNGTVIPARGHYLAVGSAYSLANYGGAGAAAGNQTMTSDIESDANVSVFTTSNVANVSSANRLDAVGFGTNTGGVCDLLREGTTLAPVGALNIEYSYFRSEVQAAGGNPKDTNDNSADLLFADTAGTTVNGSARLGAPGPENLSSPIRRDTSGVGLVVLDATASASVAPNRVRDPSATGANAAFGTLSIRRRVTNTTGAAVTRLRFRVVEVTGFPGPGGGVADVRPVTSADVVVSNVNDAATCASTGTPTTAPCQVTARATTLETPPAQPNGGGYNSTLSVALPGGGLANGASMDVNFLLGVQTTGTFRFLIIVEALP